MSALPSSSSWDELPPPISLTTSDGLLPAPPFPTLSSSSSASTTAASSTAPPSTSSSPSPTASTTSTSTGNGKSKVAQASKQARERRKREFETLVEENQRLREERERHLKRIELLQSKVSEMRETEQDIDVQLENELLKAQLSEHSMFVSGLIKMTEGVPASTTEKKQLYKQGADYANVHITSLLTRSVRMPQQWTKAQLPDSAAGLRIAVQFQHVPDLATGLRRLHLRVDQILCAPITAEAVASTYWQMWTNTDAIRDFVLNSGLDHIVPVQYVDELLCVEGEEGGGSSDKGERIVTVHTRDALQHHVFVASRRETSIARGSLAVAMDGDVLSEQDLAQPWKRQKCTVCARSNTNVMRTAAHSNGSGSSSNGNGKDNVYVDGCVVWDLEGGGCRIASVMSIMEDFEMGGFRPFDFITADGRVDDTYFAFTHSFFGMVMETATAATNNKRVKLEEEEEDNA